MRKKPELSISIIGPSTRFLSGISYYTIRLCNALSDKGTVKSVTFRNMLPKRLFPGWKRIGQTDISINLCKDIQAADIIDWYNPLSWAAAARIVRHTDITIFEWWTSSVAHMYLAIQLFCRKKTRFVIEFHEVVDPLEYAILPLRLYAKILGRIIRKNAFRFIVHSEHDRRLIASQYRIDLSNISVIPHGLYDQYPILEREKSKKSLGAGNRFVTLFFGLIRPYKGVPVLIRAFEMLPENMRNNMVLVIAGEAWEDQETISLVEGSPERERIIFENRYIADSDVSSFFSAADLLILPYTRASQSGVAHIGVSYGLPIIASQVGGLSESLGAYTGTRFIPHSDPNALARAIGEVYKNQPASRYPPPEELRWERIADKFREELLYPSGERV